MRERNEEDSIVPLADLGVQLGIGPKAFRAILSTYSDLLPVREVEEERGVASSCVQLLERIYRRTLEGHTEEEIRAELERERGRAETGAAAEVEASDADEEILELLREVLERLEQAEKRRVEDRDKLMMTLLRTQKEMQQVRYELAKTRGRRRKGLWNRFRGT
ncbi:MAG: phosphotransferase [Bacillota bacterium]